MKPSTAASRTVRAASSRKRESGSRSNPFGASSIALATPRRNGACAGSVNA